MSGGFKNAMARSMIDARNLVQHLNSLGDREHASRADLDRARALADQIEACVYGVIRDLPQSEANALSYQALESVDSLRAAADGNDVAMMRGAAQGIYDRLHRACEAFASAPGEA
jgi:alkylhydroperoxidase family enzyme